MILRVGPPYLKIVLMMAFTTVALLIPEPWSGLTDTPGLFLSGHQPACPSKIVELPNLRKRRSKLHFKMTIINEAIGLCML